MSSVNYFRGVMQGNTVHESPVFGVTSQKQVPFAFIKVAVNFGSGDNKRVSFCSVQTYNPGTIAWLKQSYRKGMIVNVVINEISIINRKTPQGDFAGSDAVFKADAIWEIKAESVRTTEEEPQEQPATLETQEEEAVVA